VRVLVAGRSAIGALAPEIVFPAHVVIAEQSTTFGPNWESS